MRAALAAILLLTLTTGCAGTRPANQQSRYAKLRSDRVYDAELPAVWKGIEKVVANYKVTDRDPSEVDPLEYKKVKKRELETDWIYSQSRDKYQVAWTNGVPKQIPLQSRIRYKITAERQLAG